MPATQAHPLLQIASNPTHKLLLKQWLKEQHLILTRISFKETQLDSTRKEITHLHCLFFLFHSASLLLLFSAAAGGTPRLCARSWIPSLCSSIFSLGLTWAFRYKSNAEFHLEKVLEREKEDSSLLEKCVEELRRKGAAFDLLMEVDALRRAKSLMAEARPVRRWSARDFSTLFFLTALCVVLGLQRIILCG